MKKYTKKVIQNKDMYTIFYSDTCGYSIAALDHLKKKNLPFKGYLIDKNGGMTDLLNDLGESKSLTNFNTEHETKPVIFKNGNFVGGYDQLIRD